MSCRCRRICRRKNITGYDHETDTCRKRIFRYIGSFTSETEAARAYNAAAIKHHGEFARLNIL
jgi:hypothetical protein